jgi:hypothetical protein
MKLKSEISLILTDPSPVISKLLKTDSFLETELDAENIKNFVLFDKTFADSSSINQMKASVHLEEVNDTIITYSYDDNFNEVEKKTFQKIIQPNYIIDFQSLNPEKTKLYFQNKNGSMHRISSRQFLFSLTSSLRKQRF